MLVTSYALYQIVVYPPEMPQKVRGYFNVQDYIFIVGDTIEPWMLVYWLTAKGRSREIRISLGSLLYILNYCERIW